MGLDVDAYKNVEALGDSDADSDEVDADFRIYYADPDFFPDRCTEFHNGTPMRGDICDEHLTIGYGTYNRWREELSKLACYPLTKGRNMFDAVVESYEFGAIAAGKGPFWELIWFPDNEGDIGFTLCKKLAADFEEYDSAAEDVGGHFYKVYSIFKALFEHGAENGVVHFH